MTEDALLTLGMKDWPSLTEEEISSLKKSSGELAQKKLGGRSEGQGWWEFQSLELLESLNEQKARLSIYYDLIILVGIGGSYAGAKSIIDWAQVTHPARKDFVPVRYAGQNLSTVELSNTLEEMLAKRPLVIVVGKSGRTLETSVAFRILEDHLIARFGEKEAAQRTLVVTDPHHGLLREYAEKKQLQAYDIPPDIGGRYSAFTAVGLVPWVYSGLDPLPLLKGSQRFFQEFQNCLQQDTLHPSSVYALLRYRAWKAGKKSEILAYDEGKALGGFLSWWQQLFAESEGKEEKGLFPLGMIYPTDLHSLGQYVQEGPALFLETFLTFAKNPRDLTLCYPPGHHPTEPLPNLGEKDLLTMSHKAMESARLAHGQRGTLCLELSMPRLDGEAMGYLMGGFFPTTCALSAHLLGVFPFDQPGVEAYKNILKTLLR